MGQKQSSRSVCEAYKRTEKELERAFYAVPYNAARVRSLTQTLNELKQECKTLKMREQSAVYMRD